ncbi:hypothetical protein [Streptosporangium roseum]|uniref:Uncharacterized protein n=1 Tax=Streptosporangium roseum (strain ATCC 12428 / DSM 43021 / JCM 3005 / KCTC 9067 / NCIMB 10171 / NRRL 2505 / NI 9100) TaxID=479432 RepID=D2BFY2_STRRD|nr:hypothetical protein [Streptosporangium roseum]ACZ92034.1 hypothetical protein Sros_9418 [Streptosporangium roseum DSM 43021]
MTAPNETTAIAALRQHLTTAPAADLLELARTCPDHKVRAAADRVAGALERLRTRLAETTGEAYRHAEHDQAAPQVKSVEEGVETAPVATETAPQAPAERRRTADRPAPAAPRTPRRTTRKPKPRRSETGNDSGLGNQLGDRGMFTGPIPELNEEELAATRRLCARYGRSPAEVAELIDMLGVA